MHKKIMKKAAKALEKDVKHYVSKIQHDKNPAEKKHDKVELKEAKSAAKDMASRSKKAHEYY